MKINQLLKINLLFLFIFLQEKTFAQVGINTTGTPPATNAMLDISSTTKGLLIPRMTTAQRNALAHAQGLTVFDITTNSYWYSGGAAWINLATTLGNPWLTSNNNISNTNLGNIGIGTNTPKAFLNVAGGKTILFGNDTSGTGDKLIWIGSKGAFRAGYGSGTNWNDANVGENSIAMGNATKASGNFSTALGNSSTASGIVSTAIGFSTNAIGNFSTAIGKGSNANGSSSTAIGVDNTANGDYSTAMGNTTTANGTNSIAFGIGSTASGNNSTAMGVNASTANHTNSFCIGGTINAANNTADNQMLMRFDNYTFWVTPLNYAYLTSASNGWAYTSDRNKKENFEELNGESVLKKIAKIPFYSWNFKAKESKEYRHYGIMAQDFHDNFGKDNLGVIGNDTTVSTLDLLGVAYSGIKALEKRTEALQNQNEILVSEIAELKAMIQPKRKKYAIKKVHPAKKEELFTLK
jgi:hypothetical protein